MDHRASLTCRMLISSVFTKGRFIFCEWNIVLRSTVWNVGIVFLMTYVFSDCRSHSLWYFFFQIGSVASHYVCPCWRPDRTGPDRTGPVPVPLVSVHKRIILQMRFFTLSRWINIIEGTSQVGSSSNSGGASLEVRHGDFVVFNQPL
jgi:hypothetical protein